MQDPGAWAAPLTDSICADASLTGGKAAGLHQLLTAGLPVPPGYVLPLPVFEAHLPAAVPAHKPERPAINDDLRTTLARICQELSPGGEAVVVRSSAIGEDSAQASFAGQHATYYYVDAESIDKAVVDCWLSLWSEQALDYRAERDAGAFGMAVIIQRMVQAERSGVCFSCDPTGKHPDQAVLEATWGLGAALVDGRVSPDRFHIDESGRITARRIARKRLKVAEDLRDRNGSRLEPIPLKQQTEPAVSDIEAAQLATMARQIAADTGTAQDVEWAIDGDEVFLLQSRPITGQPPVTPKVEGRWVLFKPTAENFSEPMTPMTVDLLRRVVPPFGRFIGGRFYVNVDLLARLLPWDLDDESLADVLLMRPLPESTQLSPGRVAGLVALLSGAYLTGGVGWHRTANLDLSKLSAFESRCRQVLDAGDIKALPALTQLVLNDHPFRPAGEFAVQANISSVRYFILIEALRRLLSRWAPDFDETKLALICSGGADMLSQQMVEGVRELAAEAAADSNFAETLKRDDVDLQGAVLALGEYHPFAIALERFMNRFGHRCVRELELMTPRWWENNTTVLAMVRSFLAREPERTEPYGLRLAAEDELHQALKHRWQRRIADYLAERIRYYVTLRENTRYYHTMAMDVVRQKLKALEQTLLQTGRLRCEDDLFFLEYQEAMALELGQLEWQDVEERIRERRLHYQDRALQTPPDTFNLEARIPVLSDDGRMLMGDCASPGVATGRARIIHDPTLAGDLKAGEILVAPYTDPAWTPLFPGAAAIIVEVGSFLSHAGTVAREYQVPCLVDVHGATTRISDGAELRVNASEGWVEVLTP
ncbi:MAG: PEP/pyruvate-binding domain-containing protein [Pseudomonadota bacterium]